MRNVGNRSKAATAAAFSYVATFWHNAIRLFPSSIDPHRGIIGVPLVAHGQCEHWSHSRSPQGAPVAAVRPAGSVTPVEMGGA